MESQLAPVAGSAEIDGQLRIRQFFGANGKKSIARSGFRNYYFKVENDGFKEVSLGWVF